MSARLPRLTTANTAIAACVAGVMSAVAAPPAFGRDTDDQAVLTLVIEDVAVADGSMMVALFRSAAAWDADEMERGVIAPVATPETTVTFADLEPGEYAVKLYHDEDGDGALDTGFLGVPSEPYGFSNNARGRFGPASYEDARFTLAAGETRHAIRLID